MKHVDSTAPAPVSASLRSLMAVFCGQQRLLLTLIRSPLGTKHGPAIIVPGAGASNRLRYEISGHELYLVVAPSCRGRTGRIIMDGATEAWAVSRERSDDERHAFERAILASIDRP